MKYESNHGGLVVTIALQEPAPKSHLRVVEITSKHQSKFNAKICAMQSTNLT